jgi:hypothetical protein
MRVQNTIKSILSLLFFGFFCAAAAQSVWVGGSNEFPDTVPGYGNMLIGFESGAVKASPASLRMNFEGAAAAADSFGQLLFYTNGCYVADAQGDTMAGGEGLNPGEMADWSCPTAGYLSPKGAMVLAWPGRSKVYCLLHMGVRYDAARKITYGPLYYSVIDLNKNNGQGEVVSKNQVLLDGDLEPFTAVRHGNGRDWWVVVPEYPSNRYHCFLISPAGIAAASVQAIGPAMSCKRIGSSAFSLNGLRYGRQQNCRTVVMDFDRCAGIFSGPVEITTPSYTFGGGGIGFSPDGSRVFTTSQLTVLEADMTQLAPRFDTLIFTYNYWQWGTSMGLMQQGPDHNLYISNMGREKYISRVTFGQADGSDAQFEFKALPLPRFSVRTAPNDPNYRLGDLHASPCDTLGINPTAEAAAQGWQRVALAPNPARAEVFLSDHSESLSQARSWRLYAPTGACVLRAALAPGVREQAIPLGDLPAGLYFWELCWPDGRRAAGKMGIEN